MKSIAHRTSFTHRDKGFTLAELLIVIAIIAVLVAIAIPVFTTQLERARDTATLSELRTAYAEATTALISGLNAPPGSHVITDEGIEIGMPEAGKPLYSGSTLYKKDGAISVTVPRVFLHGHVTGVDLDIELPFVISNFDDVFNDEPGFYNLHFYYVSEIYDYSYLPGAIPTEYDGIYKYDHGYFDLVSVEKVSD